MRSVRRVDDDIGLRINRLAFGQKALKFLARISTLEQGSRIAALDAADKQVHRCPKPYRDGVLGDPRSRKGIENGAATGRQYMGRPLKEPENHAALPVAELCLSKACEYLVYRA